MDEKQAEELKMFLGWVGYEGEEADKIIATIRTWLNDTQRYIAGGPV